ncbi:acyl-CoA/acyl-ACP dehydrogenase [Streptomyces oceani]|uniref:Acyl-CoA dehydrogenase n=1 Tax=Streptomyces oceani TaxID=1075402 RepID=A0A1E7KHH5_9ACTN|nr:acyl-CoA/acyl-ACP dehydrogenase [Streptomyces oceani]OEV03294.1 hypothetical protein AN216_12115 [Streptomyces oceani]
MNRIAILERSLSEAGSAADGVSLALRACGFPAEFVPERVGGRLRRVEELHQVVRTVLRMDLPAAAEPQVSGFPTALRVWAGGCERQQRRVGKLLLRGGRLAPTGGGAAAPHDSFTARIHADELRLSAGRTAEPPPDCQALVVTARHDTGRPDRDHTALLLTPDEMPSSGRSRTVSWETVLGEPGSGLELALRAARLSHGLYASTVLARLDTLLRAAVESWYASEKSQLVAPPGADVLAGAFLDLLVSDCVTLCAARAAHLVPDWAPICSAAAGYLAKRVLKEAGHDLSTVLEVARRDSAHPYRGFSRRLSRLASPLWPTEDEVPPYTVLVARLPARTWRRVLNSGDPGESIPDALYQLDAPLPALDLARPMRCSSRATDDPLLSSLAFHALRVGHAGEVASHPCCRAALVELLNRLVSEAAELSEACAPLEAAGPGALLGPYARSLAERYALLVAATACVGVWSQRRDRGRDFLAEPCWLTGALHRIVGLLGAARPEEASFPCLERIHREVLARYDEGLSYDLHATSLAGPATLGG